MKIVSFTLLALIIIGLSSFLLRKSSKIGVVRTLEVFDKFDMKVELEKDYQSLQIVRLSYLDSLKLKIQTSLACKTLNDREKQEVEYLRKLYMQREDEFNVQDQKLYSEINDKIFSQINQYLIDYAKDNGFDLILGAKSDGTVMYSKNSDDITNQIIAYINERYHGKISK